MVKNIATLITVIFHPVLIPTFGFLLLFNSDFYFSMLTWEVKRYVLLIVLFSTGILPMLSVAILAINPKFNINMDKSRDRIMPLLFSSVFYYIGFILLGRMKAYPIFKLFLVASVLVIIVLLVISFRWKISNHMAALGGLTGTIFALSFRSGVNPVYIILLVVLVSGIVGTARMILSKHSIGQLIAGYVLGFSTLYLVIFFV